jgi:hypothetical protein
MNSPIGLFGASGPVGQRGIPWLWWMVVVAQNVTDFAVREGGV